VPLIPPQHRNKAAAAAIATALAIPAEGIRQWAYFDPPSILSVCYGHTGAEIIKNRKYSMDECKAYLTADMAKAVTIVDNCVPGLPTEVLAAFSDATYNIGSTVACDTGRSTAARLLRAGRLTEACNALLAWNKAKVAGMLVALPGLTKRRGLERDLCLKGVS
jgi:lysozyme